MRSSYWLRALVPEKKLRSAEGPLLTAAREEDVKRFSLEFSPASFLQHEGRLIAYLRDRPKQLYILEMAELQLKNGVCHICIK